MQIFWGSEPAHQSERDFLRTLGADFEQAGVDALVLANFYLCNALQVDFLVITSKSVCHIELKNYDGKLRGGRNGAWQVRDANGSWREMSSVNPYEQTVRQRFALSDDLQAFATKHGELARPPRGQFYRWFESVTCIFPKMAVGSKVPSDYKVQTLGYPETVSLACGTDTSFPWTLGDWLEFVKFLGLTAAATTPRDDRENVVDIVAAYQQAFADVYRADLHEHVATPLIMDGAGSAQPIDQLLQAGKSVQLVGASGTGKSHLALHTALATSEQWLPILVRARTYEGRLSRLLDRSVAPMTVQTAQQLMGAAARASTPILLILDGFNECAASRREQLLADLLALRRRVSLLVLLTTQEVVQQPAGFELTAISMGALSASDRRAVLASYNAAAIADMCEPFQTAFELSMAASCAAELAVPVSRGQLFDAFVRQSLSDLPAPAATRAALRQLALQMDEALVVALPIDVARRRAERAVGTSAEAYVTLDNLFHCRLVRLQQGSFAFAHELIGRFLVGEALLLESQHPERVVTELKRPRHADLVELVLPLEPELPRLRGLLDGLASAKLYLMAAESELGAVAARVAAAELHDVAGKLTALMGRAELRVVDLDSHPRAVLSEVLLTDADAAKLTALAQLLPAQEYLAEAIALLDATDRVLGRAKGHAGWELGRRLPPSALAATVASGLSGGPTPRLPAALVIEGCEHGRYDREFGRRPGPRVEPHILHELIDGTVPTSFSRLTLLCVLCKTIDDSEVARAFPVLLEKCWRSGAYHVRLQALEAAQMISQTVTADTREQIVSLLEGFDVSNNIMLSSMLVDVLNTYGLVEPPGSVEAIADDIQSLLIAPESDKVYRAAYYIYSSQFEDVVAAPYCEAIAKLAPDDRSQLLSLAARGGGYSPLFVASLMGELMRAPSPAVLPAFRYHVRYPPADSGAPQEDTACFVRAFQGLAIVGAPFELLPEPSSGDQAAWSCYAEIVYLLNCPDINEHADRLAAVWQRLVEDLSHAAVDPMYQFDHAWILDHEDAGRLSLMPQILKVCRNDVGRLLEPALEDLADLTSIFNHVDPLRRGKFVIRTLGQTGSKHVIQSLERYVEDPDLGPTALEAIRALRAND
ncbi:hypothetical protein BKA01_001011 [Pseudonocardia eucalypti]|uniref:NERD domain-containing protein n=1 Tax=Pseudonocardia eucalypti TaxID=648755 RepID=UPI001610B477|nr:hypothetical protein [Pseudonocardia eucalypti]